MSNLPLWEVLSFHYPAQEAGSVFQGIGGKVEYNYNADIFANACAIRVSKALNGAGGIHLIQYFKDVSPNGKIESQVSSGKNKHWYIFRIQMLIKYLTKKYGRPEELVPSSYKEKLKGKKGIIIFQVIGWSDATGHADLWDGSRCLWKDYGGLAHKVLFLEAL